MSRNDGFSQGKRRRLFSAGAGTMVFVMACATALACGPDYGSRLLEDRAGALLGLQAGSFATEAPGLVEPPAGLPRASEVLDRSEMERQFLTGTQYELLQSVRAAGSAQAAFERAAALPESVRHYMAGANAWDAYGSEKRARAEEYFAAAAAMDGQTSDPWPLMGEFMLARFYARQVLAVDDPRADTEVLALADKAIAGFERTRERVIAGEPDPLGLSIASLGEQARILWRLMRIDESVRLYAEQAALGSQVGRMSLFFVTRLARADRVILDAFLDFPLGRELLVLYAYTHFPARYEDSASERWQAYRYHDNIPRDQLLSAEQVLELLLPRLEALPVDQLPSTDRLAALLYRQGHFEWSERTVALADSPLADWVRAKLALRADRPEQAAEYFHLAMRGFGDIEWDVNNYWRDTRKPACEIASEASLLALTRNELTQSLKLMLEAGAVYWLDAAYLADYVLTADELVEVAETMHWSEADRNRVHHWGGRRYERPSRRDNFETLVGRRLMRAGRYDDAIAVFPFDVQRQRARQYADLMDEPADESALDKARRLFGAAVMTRRFGLNLLGYEAEPDFVHYGGNYHFEYGLGHARDDARREDTAQWLAPRELEWIRERKIRSLPRFTYRFTAAELAGQAADHLPPESEAFAAVLCHASQWLLIRYPEAGREYFYRYQREGRVVEWHDDFGQRCPVPDL